MNGHKILKYILTLTCFAFLTFSSTSFAAFMEHHPHNAEHGVTTPAAPGNGTVIAMDDNDGPGHEGDDDGPGHEDEPPVPVPEPATLFLLAIGLLVIVGIRRSHQANSIQA